MTAQETSPVDTTAVSTKSLPAGLRTDLHTTVRSDHQVFQACTFPHEKLPRRKRPQAIVHVLGGYISCQQDALNHEIHGIIVSKLLIQHDDVFERFGARQRKILTRDAVFISNFLSHSEEIQR